MQKYLVGGAVRDSLLGIPVKDRDWVVVGSSPKQMLDEGYLPVGADFPVFLHPKSKEEYALARTEKKIGTGYTGFSCDASKQVTLEQDLLRRDLTINAMAQGIDGKVIDPFNGQQDLANKILRHVSDAFIEDPLRVLRVARFAARYHHLGFSIAPETLSLMQQIVANQELANLSAERVWLETAKSLEGQNGQVYISVLKEVGALDVWFPELAVLWGIPNPAKWHPEIDTGVHTLMVMQQAEKLSDKLTVRYAALVHDLGKGLTPPEKWPSHHGHEKLGIDAIKTLSARLKVPNECRDLAILMSEYHSHIHRAFDLKASTILSVLNKVDVWRKPDRFKDFLIACTADARGRTHFENAKYAQADYIWQAYGAASAVDIQQIIGKGYAGAQIKQQLDQQRTAAIGQFIQNYKTKADEYSQ